MSIPSKQWAFLKYIYDQQGGSIDRGFIDGSEGQIAPLVKRGLLEWRGHHVAITAHGRDTLLAWWSK